MSEPALLLLDDDEVFGDVLSAAFQRRGFVVSLARTVKDARNLLHQATFDYAVIDLRVGNDSGLELVELLSHGEGETRTVVLTGYGSIATAVEAIKLGAVHYLTKPAEVSDIITALGGRAGNPEVTPAKKPPSVRRMEWEHIQKVLAENRGNISATARALGMHRRTLQRKLQKRPVRD